MQAMAKMTTSVAEVRVRPMPRSSSGAQDEAQGDDQQRQEDVALVHGSGLQPLEALAQEAARPDQKDEEHQEVHRGLGQRAGRTGR